MQKLQNINNVRIYVISHGRPKLQQRPTCKILDDAGLDYYMVMNEHQVSDYVNNGVDPKKIIVTTDEFEKELPWEESFQNIQAFILGLLELDGGHKWRATLQKDVVASCQFTGEEINEFLDLYLDSVGLS